MRTISKHLPIRIFLGCFLLCARAEADPIFERLPAEVTMNKGAGRGSWLIPTVRLETGEDLPFMVDTGCPITLVDKSLEPKLGKRVSTMRMWMFGGRQESDIHAAPQLNLGSVPLKTGSYIATFDFKQISARSGSRIMGVLGMDCLRHYCIQLDFEAGKMRFLEPESLNAAEIGKAFPITLSSKGQNFPTMFANAGQNEGLPFIQHIGLVGGSSTNSLVDTGDNVDGEVEKGVIKGYCLTRFAHFIFKSRALRLRKCVWDGEIYTKLKVGMSQNANRLGLRFLARHLVTLEFPNQTMYLKKTRAGPLSSEEGR